MRNSDLGFNPFDELSKREFALKQAKRTDALGMLFAVSMLDKCSENTRKIVYLRNPRLIEFAIMLKK